MPQTKSLFKILLLKVCHIDAHFGHFVESFEVSPNCCHYPLLQTPSGKLHQIMLFIKVKQNKCVGLEETKT